jgi:hypothetical protein
MVLHDVKLYYIEEAAIDKEVNNVVDKPGKGKGE